MMELNYDSTMMGLNNDGLHKEWDQQWWNSTMMELNNDGATQRMGSTMMELNNDGAQQ